MTTAQFARSAPRRGEFSPGPIGDHSRSGRNGPSGFVIASAGCRNVILRSGAIGQLDRLLSNLLRLSDRDLTERAREAQAMAYKATGDKSFCDGVITRFRKLAFTHRPGLRVTVRGFARIGDSLQGQRVLLGSYSHVEGEASVLEAIRRCLAASFSPKTVKACLGCGIHPCKIRPFVVISEE